MAVAQAVLSETQREALEAFCDAIVPSVETDTQDPIEKAFLERAASDMNVATEIEGLLAEAMLPEEIEAVGELLDALHKEGIVEADTDGAPN